MQAIRATRDATWDDIERYVYDGQNLVMVYDQTGGGTGTFEGRYFHGPGTDEVLSYWEPGHPMRWAWGDRLGTVRDIVETNGTTVTVVEHQNYNSFGQITSDSNPSYDFRFGYTGRLWDADAQLQFNRARWYDPALGRFLSEDPLGFAAGDTNLTRYVAGNPVNFTDPSGKLESDPNSPLGFSLSDPSDIFYGSQPAFTNDFSSQSFSTSNSFSNDFGFTRSTSNSPLVFPAQLGINRSDDWFHRTSQGFSQTGTQQLQQPSFSVFDQTLGVNDVFGASHQLWDDTQPSLYHGVELGFARRNLKAAWQEYVDWKLRRTELQGDLGASGETVKRLEAEFAASEEHEVPVKLQQARARHRVLQEMYLDHTGIYKPISRFASPPDGPMTDFELGRTWVDNWVIDPVAGFSTGYSNVVTFGHSNEWQRSLYGDALADYNQSGWAYGIGTTAGIGSSIAMGYGAFATGGSLAATGALRTGLQGWVLAGDVDGVIRSSYNVLNAQESAWDTLGFLPTIGWAGASIRKARTLSSFAPNSAVNRIAHPNLFPDEAYTPVQRFELRNINGKWKTVDARGNAFTARGNYNYVVQGDKFYVTKVPSQPAMGQRVAGHIDIARGGDVAYAGELRFGAGRGNRGQLQWWDNASGHYRPKAADAGTVSDLLPIDLFTGR